MGFYGFIFSVNSHCLVITHQFNFCTYTHTHGHKDKGKSSLSGSQCKWLAEQIKWKPASEREKRRKKAKEDSISVFVNNPIIVSSHNEVICFPFEMATFELQHKVEHFKCLKKTRWVDWKLTTQIKNYTEHKACAHNDANHPFGICLAFSKRMRACERVSEWVSMKMAARIKTASFVLKLMTKVSFICWDFFLARQPFSSLEIMCARDVSISRRFVCFEGRKHEREEKERKKTVNQMKCKRKCFCLIQ